MSCKQGTSFASELEHPALVKTFMGLAWWSMVTGHSKIAEEALSEAKSLGARRELWDGFCPNGMYVVLGLRRSLELRVFRKKARDRIKRIVYRLCRFDLAMTFKDNIARRVDGMWAR